MSRNTLIWWNPPIASTAVNTGLLVLRLFTGLALAFAHGLGKVPPAEGFVSMVGNLGLPAPSFFAWMSGIAEFAGGLLLALGLLTRPAALFIAINMTVAVLLAHADDPFGGKEKAMLFGVVALMYVLTGAGKYSVDARMQR